MSKSNTKKNKGTGQFALVLMCAVIIAIGVAFGLAEGITRGLGNQTQTFKVENSGTTHEISTIVYYGSPKDIVKSLPSCALETQEQVDKEVPCDDFSDAHHIDIRFPNSERGIYGN